MSKLFKSFLIFAAVFIVASCSSEDIQQQTVKTDDDYLITIDEAKEDLLSLLVDIEATTSESRDAIHRAIEGGFTTSLGKVMSRTDEQTPLIHVFNFTDNNGFAIMSGDKRVPSLLALAENGSLTEDTEIENPGLAIFMAGLNNQGPSRIKDKEPYPFVDPNDPDAFIIYGEWENKIYGANGSCPVKWGQGVPYNKYCPEVNGLNCVTGCVATAVAQLMAIYKYPSSYNGFVFNWDEMTRTKIPLSDVAKNDVARIMQQLGLGNNLDMNYGLKQSGAKSKNIPRTMKSFGYSNGGELVDYYTNDIVSELKLGYPVLVSGVDPIKEQGHQWLVHGLLERKRILELYTREGVYAGKYAQYEYYPLCNWGWNGAHDGYYLSKAFTNSPKYFDDGAGYSSDKDPYRNYDKPNYKENIKMLIGIRK